MGTGERVNELHLFAGAGGGILAGQLLGHRCVCAVEWEPYAQASLVARQNDGTFPPFPIWDDVQTFDGRPWRGVADVVAGGFPCQDISVAGGVHALTENAQECGTTWPASLAKFDPATHTLKTAQLSLLEDLTGCSVTLPRSGLMRAGECWELPTLARRTSATESGFWQTPVADDAVNRTNGKWNSRGEPKLSAQVMDHAYWPTPTVHGNYNRKGVSSTSGDGLATAVKMWPTPTAQDSEQAGGLGCIASGKRGLSLHQATQQFPTPVRSDYKSGSFSQEGKTKRDSHSRGKPLNETIGGQLNPNWVEWLMGWPIGHTALEPLETGRFQEWQQQHSSC